ncbi:MAG: GMC family oxidoreductase [Chitinophagaceae bacterium BSSC1]|nr:MAG: GMC family oxidoreductase [Chitinophagaceae bacterium BSSC1]
MPADSSYLNTKATEKNTYDAIVVGSGISGGWAAKELSEKGLKVLLLERGGPMVHPNYPTTSMDPWEFPHRGALTKQEIADQYVQSRHYSFKEDTKHFYIKDKENPYEEIKRFDWIRPNVVGGRSLLWARASYRWMDADFEANAKDGHGVDWPIRYKDLEPWYSYVEKFVGVNGNKDGLSYFPDAETQPAFEMNMVEKDFQKRVASKFSDRHVIMGRSANLTAPVKGRGVCQARNLCQRGCPFGAYFSTNSSTLPAAFETGNLTLRPYSLVNRVIYDEQLQKATGVEVLDTQTKQTEVFHAKIIFLNAATVATTFILLNSTSHRFPNGLGNDSDQVGRNLMDHHKGVSINADVEGFEDSYYSGRRPTNIYIPRFKNLFSQEKNFLRGFHLAGSASRGRGNGSNGIGVELKESMSEAGKWHMNLYAYGECLPYADNRITLNTSKQDIYGRPQLSIDCSFRENELAMHKDMRATGVEILSSVGYKNVRDNSAIAAPGNANHEMGTARMGKDPKTSVLNGFNQMHAVKNVFITDGSCMSSISCVNPSITFMALTARACDYAVKALKRGDI